jgi:hypothetical protein
MEALLEREEQVDSWNDERMDELSRRMDAGFEKASTQEELNQRFIEANRRFDTIDAQFLHINDRLDRMNNTLLIGTFGVIAALIANAIFG